MKFQLILSFWALFWLSGSILKGEENQIHILVVQEAWHTGIIIQTRHLPDTVLSALDSYDHYQYIDIGWGDRDFYQTPGFPVWYAFKALFWPTTAVLRVAAFNSQPERYYSTEAKIAQIQLSGNEFLKLCNFIEGSFKTNAQEQIIPSKLAGFFIAQRKYSLFRTCNTWAALALQSCGLDIRKFIVLFAWQLFRQLEKSDHEITYIKE